MFSIVSRLDEGSSVWFVSGLDEGSSKCLVLYID